jgi:hypothetical protein
LENAANVEAGSAELFPLDDDCIDAELACSDRAGITARPGTNYQ